MNIPRLERLARILDTADEKHRKRGEPGYDQSSFTHECGTPACGLGHYAAATPNRWGFRWGYPRARYMSSGSTFVDASREFGLTDGHTIELFNSEGCGSARTAKQAARYVRAFIKRNRSKR